MMLQKQQPRVLVFVHQRQRQKEERPRAEEQRLGDFVSENLPRQKRAREEERGFLGPEERPVRDDRIAEGEHDEQRQEKHREQDLHHG